MSSLTARQRVDTVLGKTTNVELQPRASSTLQVEGDLPPLITICEGNCSLPSTTEELERFFTQNEQPIAFSDVISPALFHQRPAGVHTLFGWTLRGDRLVVERQLVSLPMTAVRWSPPTRRAYKGASVFAERLPFTE